MEADSIRPGEYRRIKIDGKLLGDQHRRHVEELRKFFDPEGKMSYEELMRAEVDRFDDLLDAAEIVNTN